MARSRRYRAQGLIEQAEHGVLFINELGDVSPAPAPAVRGIRHRSFQRAGGSTPVRFDARVISSAQPGFESRGRSRSASTC